MRLPFAILLCLAAVPATAGEFACADIESPAERLICYDARDKAAKLPPPAMRFDLPVSTRRTMPDFDGRDRAFRDYRTRLVAAARRGPNFAGHMALVQIGCGTGCSFVLAVDTDTGKVHGDFPFGGEEQPGLKLDHERSGNMLVARHLSKDRERCLSTTFAWDGEAFAKVAPEADLGGAAFCATKLKLN